MAAMKLAFFFFALSAQLGAYHARHLHDGCIHQGFNPRPTVKTAEGNSVYGGHNLEARLSSPKGPLPGGETIYGRDNPKAPPSPQVALSRGQATYLADISAPLSLKPDSSTDPKTYGRDDPTTPPSPDPNDTKIQVLYGRVDPNLPTTTPRPADPTRAMLSEAICSKGGSSCADLTSIIDGRWNRILI